MPTDEPSLFEQDASERLSDAKVIRFPVERTSEYQRRQAEQLKRQRSGARMNNTSDPFVVEPYRKNRTRRGCSHCHGNALRAWARSGHKGPKPSKRDMPRDTHLLKQSGVALSSGCLMCMKRAAANR